MGSFSDFLGEQTGFGGAGNPDPHNTDPNAYQEYYNKAVGGINDAQSQINAVGTDPASMGMKTGIQGAVTGQLDSLQDNSAGAKKSFLSDMSNADSADNQNAARAKGGTGNLAGSLNSGGAAGDSRARAEAGGLNTLNQQATSQISSLTGDQNALFNQGLSQANASAGQADKAAAVDMQNKNDMMGVAQQDNANTVASEQAGAAKRGGTMGAVSGISGLTGLFADGGRVGADQFGEDLPMGGMGEDGAEGAGAEEDDPAAKKKAPDSGGGGQAFTPGGYYTGFGTQVSNDEKQVGQGISSGAKSMGGGGGGGGGGGLGSLAMLAMANGGKIPGRAAVRGNAIANDKQPVLASPDEVIIPRSITMSKNRGEKAGKFVEHAMSKPAEDHSLAAVAKKRLMAMGGRC
jgi:hypothetical protein